MGDDIHGFFQREGNPHGTGKIICDTHRQDTKNRILVYKKIRYRIERFISSPDNYQAMSLLNYPGDYLSESFQSPNRVRGNDIDSLNTKEIQGTKEELLPFP